MLEFLITGWAFFLLYLFTWPVVVALICIGFILEANDRYIISVFVSVILLYAIWNLLALTLAISHIWVAFIVYPILGLLYAPYRWVRYCGRQVKRNNELPINTGEKIRSGGSWSVDRCRKTEAEMMEALNFRNYLDRITCWVLAWPISAAENIIGDVWREAQRFIVEVCGKIYDGITARAVRLVEFPVDGDDVKTGEDAGC